jgi:hypothetical protein
MYNNPKSIIFIPSWVLKFRNVISKFCTVECGYWTEPKSTFRPHKIEPSHLTPLVRFSQGRTWPIRRDLGCHLAWILWRQFVSLFSQQNLIVYIRKSEIFFTYHANNNVPISRYNTRISKFKGTLKHICRQLSTNLQFSYQTTKGAFM